MKTVDYSSEAISRRLRQTEQLRRLSLSLMKAKKAHDEKLAAEKAAEREMNDGFDSELSTEGDR
jgi:hypothetical protein